MTDEELQVVVEKENEEWDRKEEQRRIKAKEYEKAQRLAQYEKLKKEFENE